MSSYTRFIRRSKELSREAFLARVVTPHLFLGHDPQDDEADPGFRTDRVTQEAVEAPPNSRAILLPVAKRAGANAFPMMITLGRAPNNDVVIRDKRISTFHCYFRQNGDRWLICDVSSNGTTLNGATATREEELPISSGTVIKLAKSLEMEFLEPEQLYERIRLSKWKT